MRPFTQHTGKVVRLDRDNIDTDAIIPKQFMKSIARTGFGRYLFDEWRYVDGGYYGKPPEDRVPNPDFVLNDPHFADASILLSARNFGCGSSREHAVWAIAQSGIRVVVAASFADIFFNNCCKNGVLPVVLPESEIARLHQMGRSAQDDGKDFVLTVDLTDCTVSASNALCFAFEMPSGLRRNLLQGVDEIGATLSHAVEIGEYEKVRLSSRPWI